MGSGISSPSPRPSHQSKSVSAASLEPNAQVYTLEKLADNLRCYQNSHTGELLMLMDTSISKITSVKDPQKWNEVYLAPEAIEYFKANQASIYSDSIMSTPTGVGTGTRGSGDTPASGAGGASTPGSNNITSQSPRSVTNRGGIASNTNSSAITPMMIARNQNIYQNDNNSFASTPRVRTPLSIDGRDDGINTGISDMPSTPRSSNRVQLSSLQISGDENDNSFNGTGASHNNVSGIRPRGEVMNARGFGSNGSDSSYQPPEYYQYYDFIALSTSAANAAITNRNDADKSIGTHEIADSVSVAIDSGAQAKGSSTAGPNLRISPISSGMRDMSESKVAYRGSPLLETIPTTYNNNSNNRNSLGLSPRADMEAEAAARKNSPRASSTNAADILSGERTTPTSTGVPLVKAICQFCSEVIILSNSSQVETSTASALNSPEVRKVLENHATSCLGLRKLIPETIEQNMKFHVQLEELNKTNENMMRREISRAFKGFENKTHLNNRVLILLRSVMFAQPGLERNGQGHGHGSVNQNGSLTSNRSRNIDNTIVEVTTIAEFGQENQITEYLSQKNILILPHRLEKLSLQGDALLTELEMELQTVELEIMDLEQDIERELGSGTSLALRVKRVPSLTMEREDDEQSGFKQTATINFDKKWALSQLQSLSSTRNNLLKYITLTRYALSQISHKIGHIQRFLDVKKNREIFAFVKKLTVGGFAKIYLIKHNQEKKHYILKAIDKLCTSNSSDSENVNLIRDQYKQVVTEKKILVAGRNYHGFVNMHSTFETNKHFFFVMEYCGGGDCLNLIRTMKIIPESIVRSIIATVCLAVKWLHENGIIHRDIKPDNVFIANNGHIKLGDFGISTNRMRKNEDGGDKGKGDHSNSKVILMRTGSGRDEGSDNMAVAGGSKTYSFSRIERVGSSREGSARGGDGASAVSSFGGGDRSFDSMIWHESDSEEFTFQFDGRARARTLKRTNSDDIPYGSSDPQISSARGVMHQSQRSNRESEGAASSSSYSTRNRYKGSSRSDSYRASSEPRSSDGQHSREPTNRTNTSDSSSYYYKRSNSSIMHFTPIGNVHYMSPEAIKGGGYDHMVDWWAVGVLTFHLLCGYTPFDCRTKNMHEDEKMEQILKSNIYWDNMLHPLDELDPPKGASLYEYNYCDTVYDGYDPCDHIAGSNGTVASDGKNAFNSESKVEKVRSFISVNGCSVPGKLREITINELHSPRSTNKTVQKMCLDIDVSISARNFISQLLCGNKWERLGRNGAGDDPTANAKGDSNNRSREDASAKDEVGGALVSSTLLSPSQMMSARSETNNDTGSDIRRKGECVGDMNGNGSLQGEEGGGGGGEEDRGVGGVGGGGGDGGNVEGEGEERGGGGGGGSPRATGKPSCSSSSLGVLGHPFFTNFNYKSLRNDVGPIRLQSGGSEDSRYFSMADFYSTSTEEMPDLWLD